MDRSFTGIWTQRSVLHDPSDVITLKYYGGRPDAIWQGANVELTNNLTLKRRPGLIPFSTFSYPTPPQRGYSFQLTNGTIRVIIDTGSTGNFTLTVVEGPVSAFTLTGVAAAVNGLTVYSGSIAGGAGNAYAGQVFTVSGLTQSTNRGTFLCAASSAGSLTLYNANGVAETSAGSAQSISSVYLGAITNGRITGANNAFAGYIFQITGFSNTVNNGTFLCTASTATSLTLTNLPNQPGVTETMPGIAISTGAVYWDEQNGSAQLLFAKSPGASQTYFQGSGGILYMGDGVDTRKYTPLNPNSPYCVPGSSLTGVNGIGGNGIGASAYNSYPANPLYPLYGTIGQGTSVWNWGIVAPTTAPIITTVESGSASTQWQASTVWSTMGLIYDPVNKLAFQLNSVNGEPTTNPNATQFGETGPGTPPFMGVGTTLVDGSITWTVYSVVSTWGSGRNYSNSTVGQVSATGYPCIIYDAGVAKGGTGAIAACYINIGQASPYSTTNQNAKIPTFNSTPGKITADASNGGKAPSWLCIGLPGLWQQGHTYAALGTNFDIGNTIVEPVGLQNGLPANQTVYWVITRAGGMSQNSPYTPNWIGQGSQAIVQDNQLLWLGLGSYTWKPSTPVQAWYANGAGFSVVYDGTYFQVCTVGGTTGNYGGNTPPTFATAYGDSITESSGTGVQWTCVGPATAWTANTIWYLPTAGFIPPTQNDKLGGASVIDSNNNVEFVTSSGLGGTMTPTWNTYSGGSISDATNPGSPAIPDSGTADNQAIWYNLQHFVAQSLMWSKGYSYAYSYKSLAFDDFYAKPPLGLGNVPPAVTGSTSGGLNLMGWTGIPTGSATNVVSSASPAFVMPTTANAGAVNTVQGLSSTDPQVDTIIIWRSADGGGSGQMFELTEIPNPAPGPGGLPVTWTFKDFLPDTATTGANGLQYPGLNNLISAPVDAVNNPPYAAFLPQAYNFQRIWGSDGQYAEFSGGPDTVVGNPDEAFNPSDNIPFLAPVTKMVKTSQGLVTFLTDSIELIAGGPATSSFFEVTCVPGMGLLSFNAADLYGSEIYFFGSDNQFRVFTPTLNVVNGGFPLGDQFANLPNSGTSDTLWNPSNVYVTVYQNGIDNCIIVADGATGWYRQNPHQAGGIQGQDIVWSPYAKISGGCQMVQAIETTPGIKQLLVGGTGPGEILKRSLTVFTDNGTQYDANFTMGAITLAHPGQLALLKFMTFEFSQFDFQPSISYLLNSVSGTFEPFATGDFVFDPPSLYGAVTTPASYSPERYYFGSNAFLARCRFLQVKVDFGTTPNPDELLTMTIFGRLMVEV